jgi:hypothetical protein
VKFGIEDFDMAFSADDFHENWCSGEHTLFGWHKYISVHTCHNFCPVWVHIGIRALKIILLSFFFLFLSFRKAGAGKVILFIWA